jgi:23S rRNA pseudouridine1911/1915/1917 synthase
MNQSPQKQTFEVQSDGVRLDKYLADVCPEITRSQMQKVIQGGKVTVNGMAERSSYKLTRGEMIEVEIPVPGRTTLLAEDIPIDVIYEDNDLAVINKPPGLAVYPAPGHASHTLVNALLTRFPDLDVVSSPLRPGIVHRLDKDTSGLMVIARNERSRQYLINEFKSHGVNKAYLVLVKGDLQPEKGAIEAPIGRDPADRKRMAVVSDGRPARTEYRVIKRLKGYSLVEARIITGRTHQIRVHFAAIGHPVIADSTYGVKAKFLHRQFLHAYHLEFKLPSSGEMRTFTAELPDDLQRVLLDLSKH